MRHITFLYMILFTSFASAQIGINTTNPESTLDIRVDPNAPTSNAGIAVPQVNTLPATGNRIGQVVMNMSDTTFCYFNGDQWLSISYQSNHIGDLKHSLQIHDHGGWVKMDGRTLGELTPSQKANAISLGFISDLPDAQLMDYKSDSNLTLGQEGGSNTITITQANLPNISISGNTEDDGVHNHNIYTKQDDWNLNDGAFAQGPSFGKDNGPNHPNHSTAYDGEHSHEVNIPLGGSDTPITILPKYLNANAFVFLGK